MRVNLEWHTPGVAELPEGLDRILRIGSRVILAVVILVLVREALAGDLPQDPEGDFTDDVWVPLQLSILGLTTVGLALSLRWMGLAAAVVAVGGGALGVLSTLEYKPPFGFFVLLGFLVPAVMMWLEWQHRETLAKIVALAIGTTVILAGTWFSGGEVYAHFNGPFHPQSMIAGADDSPVRWVWSGAVEADSFTVTARLRDQAANARLIVWDGTGFRTFVSDAVAVVDPDQTVSFVADGLEPATPYTYAIEIDGVIDEVRAGRVRTFPDGAGSFTLAVASCANNGSNGVVYETIRQIDPDLYLITGDLHYRNISQNDPTLFEAAMAEVHGQPAQSALYRSTPIAYIWDDHDFGSNNANAGSGSRRAAWSSYRTLVPHYQLPAGGGGAIYQAFTIGRVRVVMTDTRSMRDPQSQVLLGDDQLAWLLGELLTARETHAFTLWVSSTPWISPAEQDSDLWGGFPAERDRIGEFLAEHRIGNLVMVSGDAHMVAIDDGTNSGYGGHSGFPVLQAGALDRPGSIKGGPYSHGTFPGAGQFGLVEVTDDGGTEVEVTLSGMDYTGSELVSLTVNFDAVAPQVKSK